MLHGFYPNYKGHQVYLKYVTYGKLYEGIWDIPQDELFEHAEGDIQNAIRTSTPKERIFKFIRREFEEHGLDRSE